MNPVEEICRKNRITMGQLCSLIQLPQKHLESLMRSDSQFPQWVSWRLKEAKLIDDIDEFNEQMSRFKGKKKYYRKIFSEHESMGY